MNYIGLGLGLGSRSSGRSGILYAVNYDAARPQGPLAQLPAGTTFTRASAALAVDHNGVMWVTKSGEIAEWGARRCEQLLPVTQPSVQTWVKNGAAVAVDFEEDGYRGIDCTSITYHKTSSSFSAGEEGFAVLIGKPNTPTGNVRVYADLGSVAWSDFGPGGVPGSGAGYLDRGATDLGGGWLLVWVRFLMDTAGGKTIHAWAGQKTAFASIERAAPGQTEPHATTPKGQARSAWLRDELVSNPDFANGLTGWSTAVGGASSVAESGGIVSLLRSGGTSNISLSPFVAGKPYQVTVRARGTAGGESFRLDVSGATYTRTLTTSFVDYVIDVPSPGAGWAYFNNLSEETTIEIDSVSIKPIVYPWGVDGVEYFTTDESGSPIPDATMEGIIVMPSFTNVVRAASDLTQSNWTKAAAALTVTAAYDQAMSGGYTQVRNLGATGVDSVSQGWTGLTNSGRYEPCWIMRAVDASGVVRLRATTGAGDWDIDLSAVAAGDLINRNHAAVTVNTEIAANGSGALTLEFDAESGSLDFDISCITLVAGTAPAATPIPNSSTSTAATRNADTLVASVPDGSYSVNVTYGSGATEAIAETGSSGVTFTSADFSEPTVKKMQGVLA